MKRNNEEEVREEDEEGVNLTAECSQAASEETYSLNRFIDESFS